MAGSRGVALLVLLLSFWRGAKLQPVKIFSGPTTEMPPRSKSQEDVTGVFDEILVQEMLDPNKSSMAGKLRTASTLPTKLLTEKNPILDETFQAGGLQSFRGLSDNPQLSLGSEDKLFNNEPSTDESYRIGSPEGYGESQVSPGGKKNLQTEQFKKLSILDKILQNIGKTSGNSLQ